MKHLVWLRLLLATAAVVPGYVVADLFALDAVGAVLNFVLGRRGSDTQLRTAHNTAAWLTRCTVKSKFSTVNTPIAIP